MLSAIRRTECAEGLGGQREWRRRGHERVKFEEPLLQSLKFGSVDWLVVRISIICVVGCGCSGSSGHRRQCLGNSWGYHRDQHCSR